MGHNAEQSTPDCWEDLSTTTEVFPASAATSSTDATRRSTPSEPAFQCPRCGTKCKNPRQFHGHLGSTNCRTRRRQKLFHELPEMVAADWCDVERQIAAKVLQNVVFPSGPMGMIIKLEDGEVLSVDPEGVGRRLGVKPGWKLHELSNPHLQHGPPFRYTILRDLALSWDDSIDGSWFNMFKIEEIPGSGIEGLGIILVDDTQIEFEVPTSETWKPPLWHLDDLGVVIDPESGATLLHLAVSHGKPALISWLITNGAPISKRSAQLYPTPLHIAVSMHDIPTCRTLLEAGADLFAGGDDRVSYRPFDTANARLPHVIDEFVEIYSRVNPVYPKALVALGVCQVPDDTLCPICLAAYESGRADDWARMRCCRQLYHHECIMQWWRRDLRCPTCRRTDDKFTREC